MDDVVSAQCLRRLQKYRCQAGPPNVPLASVKLANQMAKDIVSARLSISLREVDQALEKCLSSTLRAKIK